jgi:CheY-like chemotaxis protein
MAMSENGGRARILLAEDDPAVLKVTQLRLVHEGYEVIVAMDGEQAVEQASADGAIDLILLDIKMPKLDGFQVCKRLKTNPVTRHIPIILFTASMTYWQQLVDRCIDLGVNDWLKKPFDTKELIEKVAKALNARRARHG